MEKCIYGVKKEDSHKFSECNGCFFMEYPELGTCKFFTEPLKYKIDILKRFSDQCSSDQYGNLKKSLQYRGTVEDIFVLQAHILEQLYDNSVSKEMGENDE